MLLCGVCVPSLFPLGKHLMSFVFMGVKIVKHVTVTLVYCFCRPRRRRSAKGLSCYFYVILNAKINFPMPAFLPSHLVIFGQPYRAKSGRSDE